jgi:hypothetical protein
MRADLGSLSSLSYPHGVSRRNEIERCASCIVEKKSL